MEKSHVPFVKYIYYRALCMTNAYFPELNMLLLALFSIVPFFILRTTCVSSQTYITYPENNGV